MANKNVMRYFEKYRGYMEDRVRDGIEQNRKGYGSVTVTDASGAPVQGARVKLRQKRHEFSFGANLFMLEELESEEKNARYKEYFKDLFNLATLPFYWNDLEPKQGKPRFAADSEKVYRRPTPDLCLDYCAQNGITPKAHCLTYVDFSPSWVPDDVAETKRLLEVRYRALSERYAGRINGWEVINETLCGNERNDPKAFFRMPDLIEWNFALAEKYFTANELIINEASAFLWENYKYDRSNYYLQIERALSKGARIDAVGMQFHMFYPEREAEDKAAFYLNPKRIYDVLDTYARLNRPIQITEITIPAYSWGTEDEELQAEILENLYKIWFSHPAMEAIIYWNLVDGYAAWAPQGDMTVGENVYHAGLVRYDFTKKPAYHALRRLLHETWHTETECVTGADGTASFKGFYGDYDAEIVVDGKTSSQMLQLRRGGWNESKLTIAD